jgi:hypothetical protein
MINLAFRRDNTVAYTKMRLLLNLCLHVDHIIYKKFKICVTLHQCEKWATYWNIINWNIIIETHHWTLTWQMRFTNLARSSVLRDTNIISRIRSQVMPNSAALYKNLECCRFDMPISETSIVLHPSCFQWGLMHHSWQGQCRVPYRKILYAFNYFPSMDQNHEL